VHLIVDAMESTGVYWKPVWNILEAEGFDLLLANAQEVKIVPGRKTDQKDSQWIADLHQHGLLRKSFVPPRQIRDLRDLTRSRATLAQEHSSICNRIQKVLEDANIKLGAVASDVFGASGRAMLRPLMKGESDAEALAELSKGRLRNKIPELRRALEGCVTGHHRFLIDRHWRQMESLENQMRQFEREIAERMKPTAGDRPHAGVAPCRGAAATVTARGSDLIVDGITRRWADDRLQHGGRIGGQHGAVPHLGPRSQLGRIVSG
jgi:transposase